MAKSSSFPWLLSRAAKSKAEALLFGEAHGACPCAQGNKGGQADLRRRRGISMKKFSFVAEHNCKLWLLLKEKKKQLYNKHYTIAKKVRTQHNPWGPCISFGSQWKPAQGSLVNANSSINILRCEEQCGGMQCHWHGL